MDCEEATQPQQQEGLTERGEMTKLVLLLVGGEGWLAVHFVL